MFTYIVQRFKQHADSELEILSFVAPADQIVQWAGVPRKSELGHDGIPVNFQRALENTRVSNIRDFFGTPTNLSPTSIVIALRDNANFQPIQVELPETTSEIETEYGLLTITPEEHEGVSTVDILQAYSNTLSVRLGDDQGGEQGEMPEEDESDEFVLYESHLRQFNQHLLTTIERVRANPELEEEDAVQSLRETVISLSRPAMIVDGQHRVNGAAAVEQNIPFSVCAINNCPWEEQVFQFVVVNQTAKPIPGNFLSSITSTSLTTGEIDSMRARLRDVGVNVDEHEMMDLIDQSQDSPFREMINFGVPGEQGQLKYVGMKKLANQFRKMTGLPYDAYFRIYVVGQQNRNERKAEWMRDEWSRYFFKFWETVRTKFDAEIPPGDEPLWQANSQLLRMKTLEVLQKSFVAWMQITQSPLPVDLDEFATRVSQWLTHGGCPIDC